MSQDHHRPPARYPSKLQLWKHYDYESGGDHDETSRARMRISNSNSNNDVGSTTNPIVASFVKAMNDPTCVELDLHDIEFDYEESEAFVHMLRCSTSSNSSAVGDENDSTTTAAPSTIPKCWKSIKLYGCRGQVYDIVMACMSFGGGMRMIHADSSSSIDKTLSISTNTTSTTNDSYSFTFQYQSGNMSNQTMQSICYGIKYNPYLVNLSITTRLTNDIMNVLCRSIARNTTLLELCLAGSTIDDPITSMGGFGFSLRLNRTLQSLNLDGCHLDDGHVALILNALLDHPQLKCLSLQQNSCHDSGMSAVAALLHQNQLQELDLSYLLRKKKEPKPVDDVPEPEPEEKQDEKDKEEDSKKEDDEGAVEESKEDVKDNDEGDEQDYDKKEEDRKVEAEKPKNDDDDSDDDTERVRNTSLKILQIAGNNLNDAYIESLIGIFGKDSQLTELNLFGNRITDRGVSSIIKKIPKLRKLKSLWLGHNQFTGESAKELLRMLEHNNFILEDVTIRTMDSDPIKESIQEELDYYTKLNRGGRKILGEVETSHDIPLSLWPYILQRTNHIYWGGSAGNVLNTTTCSHAADTIFCLLHGPVLFANPNLTLPPIKVAAATKQSTVTRATTTSTSSTTSNVTNGYDDTSPPDGDEGLAMLLNHQDLLSTTTMTSSAAAADGSIKNDNGDGVFNGDDSGSWLLKLPRLFC